MSNKKPDTRTHILNSAWKLLEAGDGTGVRMSDIAKDAGVSRQAVYLHFPTRTELLVATTRHLDEVKKVDDRLTSSRTAATGLERLDAFIEVWGNYIPEIYGVAKALLALKETDGAAAAAWDDRMKAVRQGCHAAILALKKDGDLSSDLPVKQATDALWAMLSIRQWELLTIDCGWSQKRYIEVTKTLAHRLFVAGRH